MKRQKPWCLCGCGPSFRDPGGYYRLLSLNRAICALENADAAFLSHLLTIHAVRNDLHKARKIYVGHPLDTGGNPWLEPMLAPFRDRLNVFCKIMESDDRVIPKNLADLKAAQGLCQRWSIASAAICWLRLQGVRKFYSVGLDGGTETAETLVEPYRNREIHKYGSYDMAYVACLKLVVNLEMTWRRI